MGVCYCSMFCCTLLNVHSSIAIILMGKSELVALPNLSSWCLVMAEWLFLAVSWGCLRISYYFSREENSLLGSFNSTVTVMGFMPWKFQ